MTSMTVSPTGLALIEKFEGCILAAYDDATERILKPGQTCRGTLTIGIGHTSAAGLPTVYIGQVISKQQAQDILANDLRVVEREVNTLVSAPLNQHQFDAVVSFQYNTGWLSHPSCSLLAALNARNYAEAANCFHLYDESDGRVLQGLVRRRLAEKELFLTPVNQ